MPASRGLPTLHLWPEPPTSQPIHQQPTPHPEQHEAQALRPSPKTHTATQAVAQEVLGASWPLWPLEPSCHVPHCLLVPCCASLRPTFKMRPWDSVSREAPAGWRQPRGSVLRCPSPSRTLCSSPVQEVPQPWIPLLGPGVKNHLASEDPTPKRWASQLPFSPGCCAGRRT